MLELSHRSRTVLLSALFALFALGTTLVGQEKGGEPDSEQKKGKGKFARPGEIKKYEDVITAKAKTSPGVFTVHRIDDKIYFEISPSVYGKLMLWTTEVAK